VIPFKPADDLVGMLVPVLVVLLVLLLAAAWAALAALKRRGVLVPGGRQARRLRLVERLPVSRRSALLLVEYDGRPLLLGESGEQLRLLEPRGKAE
jgi:flagellar biogenesis protein FliO